MVIAADLHLDGPPAALHHAMRPLRRQHRLDSTHHEFQADAGIIGGFTPPARLAAQELVDRYAQRLPLEIE